VNPLAQELNEMIAAANPNVMAMLSDLGKELFFPKGILSQGAEAKAKAKKVNATVGMALEDGAAMFLPSVMAPLDGLTPDEALRYAPPTGLPGLRGAWRAKQLRDNPTLADKPVGMPIATNGLTHALSIVGDMFINPGDTLILPDKIWGNYRLTFLLRRNANIVSYPLYNDAGGFNVDGLKATLRKVGEEKGKAVVLLNFPNNPTGYAPTKDEVPAIAQALIAEADAGTNLVCMTDDAYFGLFYEDDVCTESLFAHIAGAHERLLAIKGDAATKEMFVWGLRVGFLSYSIGGSEADSPLLTALEKKTAGCIRSLISNCSMISQQVCMKALTSPEFIAEAKEKAELLKSRALEVKRVLADPKYADEFEAYPFNSGYFMCLKVKNTTAEALRVHLLDKYAVGTIAASETDLRIAFSCVEKAAIAELFETVYQAAKDLSA
jgi:aspartate/methionine/tyrosine aminotransferase